MGGCRNAVYQPRKPGSHPAANAAVACTEQDGWCMGTSNFYYWGTQNPVIAPGSAAGNLWPNHTTKATAKRFMFPVPNGEHLDPCGNHNYTVRKRMYVYSPARSGGVGVNFGADGAFGTTGPNDGWADVVFEFDEYVDVRIFAQSFSGGNERLIFAQNVDEHFPGPGSSWSRVSDYGNGVSWSNNNNAANSEFRFHRTKYIKFRYYKEGNLSSTMSIDFLYFYWNVIRKRCPVSPCVTPGEKATKVEFGHARTTDPIPDFFPSFPGTLAGWEYSADAGATWNPAVANQAHVAGVAGRCRWRKTFTIPEGLTGTWRVTIAGDKFDTGGTAGTCYYDGVLNDSNTELFTARHWSTAIVVDPGPHTWEWREGQNLAGASAPQFVCDYTLVKSPCRTVFKVTRTDAANVDTISYVDEDGNDTVLAPNETWAAGSCKGDLL